MPDLDLKLERHVRMADRDSSAVGRGKFVDFPRICVEQITPTPACFGEGTQEIAHYHMGGRFPHASDGLSNELEIVLV